MDNNKVKLQKSIIDNDIETFKVVLEEFKLDIETMVLDDRSNTLLHFISFNNRVEMMKLIVTVLESRFDNKDELDKEKRLWFNKKNKSGLTPIFYAIMNENLVS